MVSAHSALFVGSVWHKRFRPRVHEFKYPTFQCFLDLDELAELQHRYRFFSVDRANLISFRQADYLDPGSVGLKQSILDFASPFTQTPVDRVMVLSQPRIFGLAFNPLSLFYLYNKDELVGLVAEVHNTPWNERHRYFVPVEPKQSIHRYEHAKGFHVSPFNPMELNYRWRFNEPTDVLSVSLDVREQHDLDARYFCASFSLAREPIAKLSSLLIRFPLAAVTTVIRIYYHAFKLWLKKVPFHNHPKSQSNKEKQAKQ